MLSKEEIEEAKGIFELELHYEIQVYDTVNDCLKFKTDNHRILYGYIKELETEKDTHIKLEQQYKKEYLDIKDKYDSLIKEIEDKMKQLKNERKKYYWKNQIGINFINKKSAEITKEELEINDKSMELYGAIKVLQKLLNREKEEI